MKKLLFTAFLMVGLSAGAPMDAPHFAFVKASPAVDSTVEEAPDMIKLWFSQEPMMEGARIRLMDAHDQRIELGETKRDPEDEKVVMAAVNGEMQDGEYRVVWRAMAKDGHVVNGDFSFTLSAMSPSAP